MVGGSDGIINAWDLKSRTIKKSYKVFLINHIPSLINFIFLESLHLIKQYCYIAHLYDTFLQDHKGPVSCVRFNANDSHIASGSEAGEIIVYNVVTGQGCRPMTAPKVQVCILIQFLFSERS